MGSFGVADSRRIGKIGLRATSTMDNWENGGIGRCGLSAHRETWFGSLFDIGLLGDWRLWALRIACAHGKWVWGPLAFLPLSIFPFLLCVSFSHRNSLQRILSTGSGAAVSATVRGVQQAATEIATRLSLESYYAILGGFFSYRMYNRNLPTM